MSTTTPRTWAALVACLATLAAALTAAALPSLSYTTGFAPAWVTAMAATIGGGAVLATLRWPLPRAARRLVLAACWTACALLLWSAAGVLFDVLRVAAMLGLPALPPVVDWPGFATRAAALSATALVAATAVRFRRTSRAACPACGRSPVAAEGRPRLWLGYAAFALAFPYPLLKVYWAFGGTLGWSPAFPRHTAGGEIGLMVATAVLALGLVQRWGRRVPRWMPVTAGWFATAGFVTMGALAAFGSIAQALGIVHGPIRLGPGAWLVGAVYGGWLLLGLALAGATWTYQRETRPPCPRCGGGGGERTIRM